MATYTKALAGAFAMLVLGCSSGPAKRLAPEPSSTGREDPAGADAGTGFDPSVEPDTSTPEDCVPDCLGLQCGDDGCGGTCGTCPVGKTCGHEGQCGGCVPQCEGDGGAGLPKQCGDDGCGGSCGACPGEQVCDGASQCVDECLPACAGKQCGPDGCGDSCGTCEADDLCTNDGQCVPQGGGCDDATVVDAFPYSTSGDTTDQPDGFSYGDGDCAGAPGAAGEGAGDQAYVFTAPDTGTYTFSLETDGDFDGRIWLTAGCDDAAVSCLGANSTALDLTLDAGAVVFVIVDGSGVGEVGAYDLEIHGAGCAPDCVGKACGPDGCGGSCGVCGGSEQCTATGQCVAESGGCPAVVAVDQVPYSASGDTSLGDQVLGYSAGACPGEANAWGADAPEQVYGFTPTEGGTYTVTLDAEFDSNLYVVTDCEDVDGSCLAANDEVGSGKTESVIVDLEAGVTGYVVVDGWGGGSSGPYDLTITKGGCVPQCAGAAGEALQCGDDGCGDSCGECSGDTACEGGQCVDIEPPPPPPATDCCIAADGPGCGDSATCEQCVCDQDAYCCDNKWDSLCVNAAADAEKCGAQCGCGDDPPDPPAEACCEAVDDPGCGASAGCEQCVCDLDAFCCDTKWDSLCAKAAADAEKCAAECGCSDEPDPPPVEVGCCESAALPGCSTSATCEECVCAQDDYCCTNQWDILCSAAAKDAQKCGAECGCTDCQADCSGGGGVGGQKTCGDDGCGGTCGACGDGEVCGPEFVCVEGTGDLCDDGNFCTFDIPVPVLGCQNIPVGAPGCAAEITVESPERAAMLTGPAGVTAVGTVTIPGGSAKSVTVNGKPVTLSAGGGFSVPLSPKVGLNTLEVVVKTVLGGENVAVRAFTWAPAYQSAGQAIGDGTALFASKTVWDDDDTSDIDDLATVVTIVLENVDVASVIPNPLGSYKVGWCTYTIHVTSFEIGDPDVELVPVDGALRAIVTYPDLEVKLKAEGDGFACIDASPTVTADSLQVSLDLAVQVTGSGVASVTMANESATVVNLDIKLSGVAGFLFNWIFNFFEDDVTENIEAMVVQQLGQFPAALSDAIEQIAVNQTLAIPGLLGPPTSLTLSAKLSGADFDESGAVFEVGAALSATQKTPYSAPGSVLRQGCGSGGDFFAFPKQSPLEFAISDDLANQALFALWWGGAFEGPAPLSLLGGVDVSEYEVDIKSVDVSMMLPPVISDCDPGKGLVLGLGDIRVQAEVEVFGVETIELVAWASARVKVSAVVQGGEVGLKLGSTLFMGAELEPLEDDMAPVKPALEYLILEHLVPKILEGVGGDVLASIPVPEIPLDGFTDLVPAGTTISLDLEDVIRKSGRTVLIGAVE